MPEPDVEQALDQIVRRDPRYARAAYQFVREALAYTQHSLARRAGGQTPAHVTGRELLGGLRAWALQQFGPMALSVLHEWGVHTCEDFGEIVFHLVEAGILSKTESDSREDFRGGYDFEEAFRKPFLPEGRPQPAVGQTQPQ